MAIDIISTFDDQLNSQYEIVFQSIPGSSYNTNNISWRHQGSFELPEQTPNTYQVFFKGRSRTKIGGKDDSSKEFSLDFRVDQNWELEKAFRAWQNLTYDTTVIKKGLERDIVTKIFVRMLDGNDNVVYTKTLHDVKLKSYKISQFDYSSGEPTTLTGNFIYGKITEE